MMCFGVHIKRLRSVLLSSSMLFAIPCLAQNTNITDENAESCALPTLDKYQLMRRMSLDLRHKLPSYEELIALSETSNDGIPESQIEAWLNGEEFTSVSKRFHAALIWPSLTLTKLTTPAFHLVERGGNGRAYDIGGASGAKRRRSWRGDADINCLDELQTEFKRVDTPVTYREPIPINTWQDDSGKTIRQEGYVLVRPYWDPTNEVKVCAYAAQEAEQTLVFNNSGEIKLENDPNHPNFGEPEIASCIEGDGVINPLCGCGPNLRTCFGPGVERDVQEQLAEQVLRLIEDYAINNLPYSEMLTTDRTWTNGAIDFWWRYLSLSTSLNREFNRSAVGDSPIEDDANFADKSWVLKSRNRVDGDYADMGHSGILTLPGYTMRFQTNRSRANRFRNVFTRQYFVPPESPVDEGPCSTTAQDLTERCVCRACHQILEPLAAHWGVIAEGGSALISDRNVFPIFREACMPEDDGNSDPGSTYDTLALRKEFCPRFWVSDPGQENPGVLKPFQFAYVDDDENPEDVLDELHVSIYQNLQTGPRPLAEKIIANGQFHRAMVQHIFEYFMGRPMNLDSTSIYSEVALLETLTTEFREHDNFKTMVKRIVMLESYGRTL